jgi:hypothetical protein
MKMHSTRCVCVLLLAYGEKHYCGSKPTLYTLVSCVVGCALHCAFLPNFLQQRKFV